LPYSSSVKLYKQILFISKQIMLSYTIVAIALSSVFLFDIPHTDNYAAIAVAWMIIIICTSLGLRRGTLDALLDKVHKEFIIKF
jgi:divalent metal cation (Fe/Co/Zn/Cd) transporter